MKRKMVRGSFDSWEAFLEQLPALQGKSNTLLIGIDGYGTAGKSTLAKELAEILPEAVIVSMDDFYLSSKYRKEGEEDSIGGDYDWRRLKQQVLEPLSKGSPGRYQQYNWEDDQLTDWVSVPVGGTVIVEGVYVIRPELSDAYDLTIWIDCPRKTRLKRGVERDGEEFKCIWEEDWMPEEDRYVAVKQPRETADIILESGTD